MCGRESEGEIWTSERNQRVNQRVICKRQREKTKEGKETVVG